ncbi:type II toxin-antitoxin system prevent-host-death family antitoxin [Brevundimonas sp.]|uniref:type II toxin-antitoxin system Phd/YefM family antitoxin n=1 Tax=Brevundimonas sp. TaxID=1871086 RepID=UPI00286D06AF|nr:type II toxin-antitoxin system prevent-host-death family antitoxin [Brevundimonas sp.]
MIEIPVSAAKARLTALVRQAEGGADVFLTRNGRRVAQITATKERRVLTPEEKLEVIRKAQASARGKFEPGFDAARSADFLYGDDGMPG